MMRGPWWFVVLVLFLVGQNRPAVASDAKEEELIRQGIDLRRHREDSSALPLFQKAYELRHSPRSAAQLGLDEIALGRWIDADEHLGEALKGSSDSWIRKNQAVLREALERVRAQLGELEILGGPAGAEVVIEGEVRGRLPLDKPIRVRIGTCRVDVRAPRFVTMTRTFEIGASALTRETMNLSREVPTISIASKEGRASGGAPAEASPALAPPPPQIRTQAASQPERAWPRLRVLGIVAGGLGVAAAGTGLYFGLKARSAGMTDSKGMQFNDTADSRGHLYQNLQYVGYGVGAALVAGGVATFLLGAPKTDHANEQTVGLTGVSGGGVVATMAGCF